MDQNFAQAVVNAISANFTYTRQVDERTGGSGANEAVFNNAIAALNNLVGQMNERIDPEDLPPQQPPA